MTNKLIIFSYDFPPSNGGIARLCQEIAVGQQAYFEEVIVLTRKKVGGSNPYNFDKVQIVALTRKRIQCEKAAFTYLRNIKRKVTLLMSDFPYPCEYLYLFRSDFVSGYPII